MPEEATLPVKIRLLAFASLALALPFGGAEARPMRIVSLSLCADQYLIALADPGHIAALTRFSRDPAMSYFAASAKALPVTSATAEEVLLLRPDLVIGAPPRQRAALGSLKDGGVPMIDLPQEDGLVAIERNIALVAGAIGHPARGRALVAAMRRRLAAIGPPTGRGRVAAYYQRRGYVTGRGTLVDEMMRRLGLVNLAGRLGQGPLARLSVEAMALARPDVLILESETASVADQGTAMLHHPLLARAIPRSHILYIPQALTVCGGPFYPEAVAHLAEALRTADLKRQASR